MLCCFNKDISHFILDTPNSDTSSLQICPQKIYISIFTHISEHISMYSFCCYVSRTNISGPMSIHTPSLTSCMLPSITVQILPPEIVLMDPFVNIPSLLTLFHAF